MAKKLLKEGNLESRLVGGRTCHIGMLFTFIGPWNQGALSPRDWDKNKNIEKAEKMTGVPLGIEHV